MKNVISTENRAVKHKPSINIQVKTTLVAKQ